MNVTSRLLAGALLLTASAAFAQGTSATSTGTSDTKARIYKPIAVSYTSGALSFGDIMNSASAGTVTVAPDATRTGTLGLLTGLTGTNAAAASVPTFTASGKRLATYAITYNPTTLVGLNYGGSMTVDTFTAAVVGTGNGTVSGNVGTFPTAGTHDFTVGATLHVAASQADDDYKGTFTVTVTYN